METIPSSIGITCPVMDEAASEHSQITASATSSGSALLCMWMTLEVRSLSSGLAVSGTGRATSRCSTSFPCSTRKMSTTAIMQLVRFSPSYFPNTIPVGSISSRSSFRYSSGGVGLISTVSRTRSSKLLFSLAESMLSPGCNDMSSTRSDWSLNP
jgi:hypothetical protein